MTPEKEIIEKKDRFHNLICFLEKNDIEYKNLSFNQTELFEVTYNLNDTQLRRLINYCYRIKLTCEFSNKTIYIYHEI